MSYTDHAHRHLPGGTDPIPAAGLGPWIYVGTEGVDGVDDLLTDASPPFENDWTNSFAGGSSGLRYRTTPLGIQIQGGIGGGADGTVVATLTVAPDAFVPDVGAFADGTTLFTFSLDTDGTLTYMATL